MSLTCREVEAQLTPFVDEVLADGARAPIAAHLDACPACRRVAGLERAARRVIQEHAPRLATPAPAALHAAVRRALPAPRPRWRFSWALAAAAATLVVTLGLVTIAGVVRPIPVFAAQVTLDHLKCARLGPSTATSDIPALEKLWHDRQGWNLHIPTGQQGAGLKLMGCRLCVVTEGRIAHLFYDRNGTTLSLFVLPDGPKVGHAELEMFGQDAVLWTSHGQTYALVGRGDRAALAGVAASLEHELAAGSATAGSGQ